MAFNPAGAQTIPDSPPALLEEGLVKLGIGGAVMDSALTLLARYIEEIELFNSAYGLVKVRDRKELIVKHILDSLAPLNIIHGLPVRQIADVGSGAGLPGIPLAVCMPGAEFSLIERMGRRAGFLRDAVAILGLSNVRVEETEMEKITPAGRFDLVVYRAFRPLESAIFKGLSRLLAADGIIAAYKGRRESIEEEMARLLEAPGRPVESLQWEVFPLEVPFLKEQRNLLIIRLQPAATAKVDP